MNDKNKPLTAIEWLEKQLYFHGINPNIELFEQAKQIYKQQIMDAVDYGILLYVNDPITSEDYYTETFNLK
jgi:hypothetical protein